MSDKCLTRQEVCDNIPSSALRDDTNYTPETVSPTDSNGVNRLCTYQLAVYDWYNQPYLDKIENVNKNRIVTESKLSRAKLLDIFIGCNHPGVLCEGRCILTASDNSSIQFVINVTAAGSPYYTSVSGSAIALDTYSSSTQVSPGWTGHTYYKAATLSMIFNNTDYYFTYDVSSGSGSITHLTYSYQGGVVEPALAGNEIVGLYIWINN